MSDFVDDVERALAAYRALGWPAPQVALVAGSGLGVELGPPAHGPLPLADLLPFPVHALAGHTHRVEVVLPQPGRPVLYFRGRLHAYQGYTPHQVVLPVRLAGLLGARVLLLTNAAGGVDPAFEPGQLKLVSDHLNLTGANPLTGELPPSWGPRFPDLSAAYDPDLSRLIAGVAAELGIPLGSGVYAGLAGPSYETPAEVRMLRLLGAGLTGMSTVLEVIAARHLGLSCAALSLVTNAAAGASPTPLTHQEVLDAGRAAARDVARLLAAVLRHPGLLP
jgi:purine-nucleoside phosphorylase